MGKKANQFLYAEERKHPSKADPKRVKRQSQKTLPEVHDNVRAAKKAAYVLEPRDSTGKASRKSTRKSANHARTDHSLALKAARQSSLI